MNHKIPKISQAYIDELRAETVLFRIIRDLTISVRELGYEHSSYFCTQDGLTYGNVYDKDNHLSFLRAEIAGESYYFEFDVLNINIHAEVLKYAKEWKERLLYVNQPNN